MKRTTKMLAAIAGLTLLGANVVHAGFTTITPSKEPGHASILGDIYGGTFTASGLDFSNGSITATRVDDDLDTDTAVTGDPTKLAGFGSLPNVPTVIDDKYAITRPGRTFTTDPSDNPDGVDHVITYLLSGATTGFVLFFEDLPAGKSDFDFNDIAVSTVPLPGALASGLVSLGAMGVGAIIRRNRRRA